MAGKDQMPPVDLVKDKSRLNASDISYMKIIEAQNLQRVTRLKNLRRKNISTGLVIGAGVLASYFYTIFSVKQETFLDDFDEPATISE